MQGIDAVLMIEANAICKAYRQAKRRVPVLDRLSVQIDAGEFVAIVGPSGAGKSTLLQVLGCLDTPCSGEYWLNGREVSRLSEPELAAVRNRSIGFVFQSSHFVDYLDLVDNVALQGFYAPDYDAARSRSRAVELLRQVGLEHRLDHRPAELSGGERQRAALARALFNEPRLLLADEPSGNLDGANTEHLRNLLLEQNRAGITIVVVTHDPDMTIAAGRRLELDRGQLREAA